MVGGPPSELPNPTLTPRFLRAVTGHIGKVRSPPDHFIADLFWLGIAYPPPQKGALAVGVAWGTPRGCLLGRGGAPTGVPAVPAAILC